jgi:hypothetical protein
MESALTFTCAYHERCCGIHGPDGSPSMLSLLPEGTDTEVRFPGTNSFYGATVVTDHGNGIVRVRVTVPSRSVPTRQRGDVVDVGRINVFPLS